MIFLLMLVATAVAVLIFAGAIIQTAIIVGLGILAGGIARIVLPGEQHMAWWQTSILGICGGLAGSLLLACFGIEDPPLLLKGGAAIGGSVLLLWLICSARASHLLCLGGAIFLLSGCGYRLGIGPQRVADAGFSGPVIVDLKRPVL